VRLLNEVRTIALSIERYKQEYWRYPAGDQIVLRGDVYITENGFAPGFSVLYHGKISSKKLVTYQATEDQYRLFFRLKNTWPEQGIYSTRCQIESGVIVTCSDDL